MPTPIKYYTEAQRKRAARIAGRKYRAKNRDKICAQKREYRRKNRDKILEYERRHREENREKIRAQQRAWEDANVEKRRAQKNERRRLAKLTLEERAKEWLTTLPEFPEGGKPSIGCTEDSFIKYVHREYNKNELYLLFGEQSIPYLLKYFYFKEVA